MSSNLKVNTILPSTGTTIGIGTAGGLINVVGNIDVNSTSGISTFNGLEISGIVTAKAGAAVTYYGDGSNLTSLPSQVTISNNADNRIITGGSGTNLVGETNLTWNASALSIKGSGEGGTYVYRDQGKGPDIVLHGSRGTIASPTASAGTDLLGNINFAGHDGSTYQRRASINGIIDGTVSSNTVPTALSFKTGITSKSERFRISSNGDVRIGAGAPATFGSGTTVHETYNANTYVANLVTSGSTTLQMIASQTHGASHIGTRSNHNLYLTTNDSPKLTIDTNGNVTKPSNPAFIVGRTGGNATFTVGTFPFNVARLNVGNHYNTSTYKFTAPVAGVYYFFAQVYYNNGNGNYRVGFRKEPSGGSALMLNTAALAVVGNNNSHTISVIESLAVGDTVRVFSDQNASIQCYYNINDNTYGAHTYFMGYLIG